MKKVINSLQIYIVIIIGLVFMVIAGVGLFYKNTFDNAQISEANFLMTSENLVKNITSKLTNYENLTIKTAAFVESSDKVSREEWDNYFNRINLPENYPGISSVAYITEISNQEIVAYNIEQNNSLIGKFDYDINYEVRQIPEDSNELIYPIQYIYPSTITEVGILGFNINSELNRRNLITESSQNIIPISSKEINLLENNKKGFVIMQPINKPGSDKNEFIMFSIDSEEILTSLFSTELSDPEIDFNISLKSSDNISDNLFMDNSGNLMVDDNNVITKSEIIPFFNKSWELKINGDEQLGLNNYRRNLPFTSAIIGSFIIGILVIVISLLQFNSLKKINNRIEKNNQLALPEDELKNIFFEESHSILIIIDNNNNIIRINDEATKSLGLTDNNINDSLTNLPIWVWSDDFNKNKLNKILSLVKSGDEFNQIVNFKSVENKKNITVNLRIKMINPERVLLQAFDISTLRNKK